MRTYRRSWEDEVFGQSSRLAFYFFFALFPVLLLLILAAKSSNVGPDWRRTLMQIFAQVLPKDAAGLVTRTVRQLNGQATRGIGAASALASGIWGALNGTWAIMTGLNNAYEVEEKRSFWRVIFIALGLATSLCLLGVVALAFILLSHHLGHKLGIADRFGSLWNLAQWAVTAVLLLFSFALIYRFGPNLKDRRWQWSSPGAVAAVTLWIASAALLRLYQEHFDSTKKIYAGLSAVAMLLLFFYFTGAAIFIGGEVNSEIEKAAAEAGHKDVRARDGERSGAQDGW
ncbi:MAG TPA: YihY/virulence factor BrkB family protein [Acidobacteriaceae bacterium]|nr:YihY/virulence factor BrkB family protein [Acidobacteriaceae bacterium]